MLTATQLFLKGTLHKILSPSHLSSGISLFTHNTCAMAHKRKQALYSIHTYIHTEGVNVPFIITIQADKNQNTSFLIRGHGRVRCFSLFAMISVSQCFWKCAEFNLNRCKQDNNIGYKLYLQSKVYSITPSFYS